jgi:hypothetical protein
MKQKCAAENRWEFDAQSILRRERIRASLPPRMTRFRRRRQSFLFECEDESILDATIVDPGNSVIVRDKNNQVEYLG